MSKTAVFIDGPYFVDGTRGQGMSMNMDLAGFMRSLAPEADEIEMHYFGHVHPDSSYPNKKANDEATLARYAEQGITIHLGRPEFKAHVLYDRGVDSAIAARMVQSASQGDFDTALVISRRPELALPMEVVRGIGCRVELAFYAYEVDPDNPLTKAADSARVFIPAEVLNFHRAGPKPAFSY